MPGRKSPSFGQLARAGKAFLGCRLKGGIKKLSQLPSLTWTKWRRGKRPVDLFLRLTILKGRDPHMGIRFATSQLGAVSLIAAAAVPCRLPRRARACIRSQPSQCTFSLLDGSGSPRINLPAIGFMAMRDTCDLNMANEGAQRSYSRTGS